MRFGLKLSDKTHNVMDSLLFVSRAPVDLTLEPEALLLKESFMLLILGCQNAQSLVFSHVTLFASSTILL